MTICSLCQRCSECGAAAWCEGDPGQIDTPCPHHLPLCGDCLDACPDCRREMELEMYVSGDYNAVADPFFLTRAEEIDAAYWASGPREKPGSAGTFEYPKDAS